MTTNKNVFIEGCLNRLIENAYYTGIDAVDWSAEGGGEAIRNALQIQAELVEVCKDIIDRVSYPKLSHITSELALIEKLRRVVERAEGRE